MEEWKPVTGYEGRYEVSTEGSVRSLLSRKILRTSSNKRGHLRVKLYAGGHGSGRTLLVHRLVMLAFAGPQPEGHEVCHRDGNPTRNMCSNLRWGTKRDNTLDSVTHGTHPMARKTHCKRDHPLSGDNLYSPADGSRQCRTCAKMRTALYRNGGRVRG